MAEFLEALKKAAEGQNSSSGMKGRLTEEAPGAWLPMVVMLAGVALVAVALASRPLQLPMMEDEETYQPSAGSNWQNNSGEGYGAEW